MYDSTKDTKEHIKNIQLILNILMNELNHRRQEHDESKLQYPEKNMYDTYIPMLQKAKYGSPEYFEIRNKMQEEGLDHHYEVNRHHPEHFENGINDMTLIDIVEMFADQVAASMKSDTGYLKGLESNKTRHDINNQLYQIFVNTYNEYFKCFDAFSKKDE